MKIKLINKDKGTAPPTKAFDFRPNRTVDSNPKLDNMKGDYVSPKKQKRRKYQATLISMLLPTSHYRLLNLTIN